MRIVSLCPSNTEILAYLDLMDQVVGVDNDSDWPDAVKDIPKVGRDLNIDIEKVIELEPDLILASLSVPGMEKNIEKLDAHQLPYIILNPNSLDEIADDILTVGKYTHQENHAKTVYDKYYQTLNSYKKLAEQIPKKKRIYWEWWPKPIFTPGGQNWLTYISELAGAENIFSDINQASVQTEWKEVIDRNPDEICMVWVGVQEKKMNPELIRKREDSEKIKAIQYDDVHVLEEYLYCRPSPRLLEGLKKLAYLLHPTYFPNHNSS
ncbi:cobalamin-binding protein [Tenuibacillus multivorans]|uniref:Iron complex transport system substrate-binding protein n=1 Tax=Tenuibacillus multivorans TaxID=237069 RepID=A0A1H0EXA1_9BACI|nr:cobalamin-binding protein [Tenuibacillus multivorans]GEL76919.1 cobalamin-binding protein [Tenuibacillus multivorans]SDN87002.1 iron complex transport system substrate-binding protein [Tenuibacillus multivorans]